MKRRTRESPGRGLVVLGIGCALLFLLALGGTAGVGLWLYNRAAPAGTAKSNKSPPADDAATDKAPPSKGPPIQQSLVVTAADFKAAELDKKEPGWRLDAILDKWQGAKMAKNGADLVLEIDPLVPKGWDDQFFEFLEDDRLSKTLAAHPGLVAPLRAGLDRHQAAVTKARQFAYLPQGRFALHIENNPLSTRVRANETRKAAALLQAASMRDVLDNNPENAILAAFGILNLGRYMKEEPFAISHLVYDAIHYIAVKRLEDGFRHCNKKEASDALLASLQAALSQEGADTRFLFTVHCERGLMYDVLERLRTKRMSVRELTEGIQLPAGQEQYIWDNMDRSQLYLLEKMTDIVGIAKLPFHQQRPRIEDWERTIDKAQGAMGALLLPAVSKLHRAHLRRTAMVRTAAAAVAVERYRRANKKWPSDLKALVPKYLPSVPLDTFDGQPLRYFSYPEGVAILSVGARQEAPPPTFAGLENAGWDGALSFRLWHPQLRRPPL